MNISVLPVVGSFQWRSLLLHRFLVLLMACGCLVISTITPSKAEDTRKQAIVSVFTDLSQPAPIDHVAIRIMGNFDQSILDQVLLSLKARLNSDITNVKYTEKNIDFPQDKGLGVEFAATVTPRGEEYLPIAPFVEALAPYVNKLSVVYLVNGELNYRGYLNPYSDSDVSFTVSIKPPLDSTNPTTMYDFDVTIKNPSLTSVAFLNYPEQGTKRMPWKYKFFLATGAAIIILALGLILALLLPRKEKKDIIEHGESPEQGELTGGDHV